MSHSNTSLATHTDLVEVRRTEIWTHSDRIRARPTSASGGRESNVITSSRRPLEVRVYVHLEPELYGNGFNLSKNIAILVSSNFHLIQNKFWGAPLDNYRNRPTDFYFYWYWRETNQAGVGAGMYMVKPSILVSTVVYDPGLYPRPLGTSEFAIGDEEHFHVERP